LISNVEYNGRWKMLHYYAKLFFSPVLPSPFVDTNGDVIVELISDYEGKFSGILRVRVFKTNSMNALFELEKNVAAVSCLQKDLYYIDID